MITYTRRLTIRRAWNWKRDPGWRWECPPCPQHARTIQGFTADTTWSSRAWRRERTPAIAHGLAMDGARRHLHKFHRKDPTP